METKISLDGRGRDMETRRFSSRNGEEIQETSVRDAITGTMSRSRIRSESPRGFRSRAWLDDPLCRSSALVDDPLYRGSALLNDPLYRRHALINDPLYRRSVAGDPLYT